MKQILEALIYSHSIGIAHRDLKEDNILITEDRTVKLIDYGLSKNFNNFEMCTAVGSPLYMAPEVFKSSYNNKCDLWSLGIIIFMNYSGECPFEICEGDDLPQL